MSVQLLVLLIICLSSANCFSPFLGSHRDYKLDNFQIAFQTLHGEDVNISFFLTAISNVNVHESQIDVTGTFVLEAQGPVLNLSSNAANSEPMKVYNRDNMTFFKSVTSYRKQINSILSLEPLNLRKNTYSDSVMDITYHQNGSIIGILAYSLSPSCNFDMTQFPNDKHTCYIDFRLTDDSRLLTPEHFEFIGNRPGNEVFEQAWGKTAWKINGGSMNKVKVDWFMGTHYEKVFKTPINEMTVLRIQIDFERHSAYYHRVYIGPIALVLLLLPVIFLLPPDSTEKLTYGAVLLLILIQEIRFVEQVFPPYTDEMPRLVRLTTSCAALAFFSILVASILASFERNGREHPLPAWVKKYVLGRLGRLVLVKEGDESVTTVHVTSSNPDKDSASIIHHEQDADGFVNQNGGVHSRETISSDVLEQSAAIMALVKELKIARVRKERTEQWLNLFTILNRLMFLVTLAVGITFLFSFI